MRRARGEGEEGMEGWSQMEQLSRGVEGPDAGNRLESSAALQEPERNFSFILMAPHTPRTVDLSQRELLCLAQPERKESNRQKVCSSSKDRLIGELITRSLIL